MFYWSLVTLVALVAIYASVCVNLTSSDASCEVADYELNETRIILQPNTSPGIIVHSEHPFVFVQTSQSELPFSLFTEKQEAYVGLRFLNPLFFFQHITIDFEVLTGTSNGQSGCDASTEFTVLVDSSSAITRMVRWIPQNFGADILYLFNFFVPLYSLADCSLEPSESSKHQALFTTDGSSHCKQLPDETNLKWFPDENNLKCDHCHCKLVLPTMPSPSLTVVMGNGKSTSHGKKNVPNDLEQREYFKLAWQIKSIQLSHEISYKCLVFVVALAIFMARNVISENKLFQVALSFSMGSVIIGCLLVFILYSALHQRIYMIPGLGFLRAANGLGLDGGAAAGTTAVSGLMYFVIKRLGFTSIAPNPDDPTLPIPFYGWIDSGVPIKYVLFVIFGGLGIFFRWYFNLFGHAKVQNKKNDGDIATELFSEEEQQDSVSLSLLKFVVGFLSFFVITWSCTELLVILCYAVAGKFVYRFYMYLEHRRHIPSGTFFDDIHPLKSKDAMQIIGHCTSRAGDATPAHELTQQTINEDASWTLNSDGEAYNNQQREEMRCDYHSAPECLSRLSVKGQDNTRRFLNGESHLASIEKSQPKKTSCCARIRGLLNFVVAVIIVAVTVYAVFVNAHNIL
jgi:hypothetical protein